MFAIQTDSAQFSNVTDEERSLFKNDKIKHDMDMVEKKIKLK